MQACHLVGPLLYHCCLDFICPHFHCLHCVIPISDLYAGSKDETFFDTNVWLDSDCDDDFMSVNGGKIY